LAFKAGDLAQLAQALEARADSTMGADAADLLLEASELARAAGDDARSTALLRKARGVHPHSGTARNALLAIPALPVTERIELLAEEARGADANRAAALHAERAALLAAEDRVDEAVQACAQALALGGVDLAVLRRLARLQKQRGDHAAALAVLVQIAEAVPEGHPRAEAYGRAAEQAEWRVGDPRRALELYKAAAKAYPQAAFAWAQLGRLLAWTGRHAEAAEAFEQLAGAAQPMTERNEARRWAASLYSHRAGQPGKAASLLRALLAEAPGDLEASAELLSLIGQDKGNDARRERAELRGRLASRCQDPRVAALLRSESAEDRLAAGERDQGIAEYRRALALNPQDRVALDLVEEALRSSGQKDLLAEHLAFRCAYADGDTRAALALQQAEIFTEQGRIQDAGTAYQQALVSDPDSLLAVKGARHVAELSGDKQEVMRLLAREAGLAKDPGISAGAMVEAALLAVDMGDQAEAVQHLTTVLEQDPNNSEAAIKLRSVLGDRPAGPLAEIYERIGQDHAESKAGAMAWVQAASIKLHELNDAAGAFFAAGRALARDGENPKALEVRADAAEAAGRHQEAADALKKRLALDGGDARADSWKARLGHLYATLGDAASALPFLGAALDSLDPALLLKLAPGARSLPPAEAVRLYQRLLGSFTEPAEPAPTRAQIAEWNDELARGHLALGQPEDALATFRRSVQIDPGNRAALRHVADLTSQSAPDESIAAHRALLEMSPPAAESLHGLVALFTATGKPDAAFCAAAALMGLNLATAEERALYEGTASRPPPVDLPQLADSPAVHAPGDEGAARELLSGAAADLARALPTDMSGGRGALVKGDNPVRRVVAAIARTLGMPEPQLFLARSEPGVVAPVIAAAPAILVGTEVPRRFTPRQQRFLYARALAHVRRGTHAVAAMPAERLGSLLGELVRLAAPAGTDFGRLPPTDAAFAELLPRQIGSEARARLAPLATRAAAEMPASFEALMLGIRESAERAGMAVCADPAAAISIVAAEGQGTLEREEVARLVRFAVSETYLSLRSK
jgi:tetratricopeptide (TPR) repeat protein